MSPAVVDEEMDRKSGMLLQATKTAAKLQARLMGYYGLRTVLKQDTANMFK